MNDRKDCLCPRARHQHGTNRAYYADSCRCPDCREAHRRVSANRRRLIAYGRWDRGLVPLIGSRRRVHALMSQGWSMKALSGRLGMSHYNLEKILRNSGETVRPDTAARIADMYDELWDQPPPRDTWGENISYGKAIAHARRQGYLPPQAYDDETIDSPEDFVRDDAEMGQEFINSLRDLHMCVYNVSTSETPEIIDEIAVERAIHGDRVPLTRAEMTYAIDTLTRMGYSAEEAAARLGVSSRLVQRYRAKGRAA